MVRRQCAPPSFEGVDLTDSENLADLIADCAAIPVPPTPVERGVVPSAAPWVVDDGCYARVSGLDEYV